LETIQKKLIGLHDDVRSVALRYIAGLLVWGAAGIGKSWNIKAVLRMMGVAWREFSGTMTPRALFDQLQRFPEDIHLIEDQESLLSDPKTLSILRPAMWTSERNVGTGGRIPDRELSWSTARGSEVVTFGGVVIIAQNSRPPQTPQSIATQSRMLVRNLTVSTDEMAAKMRDVATTTPPTIRNYMMKSDECNEVAEFVIAESLSRERPLSMRLLDIACSFYVQFQFSESAQHWHDRVVEQIAERYPKSHRHPPDESGRKRPERQLRDRESVRQILRETSDPVEQLRLWRERTLKAKTMFDQRKREVERLK